MLNTSYPFNRNSQTAMQYARNIAKQNKQHSVDSLMVLLGLLQLPNSQVKTVLNALNVKTDNLMARITATIKLEAKEAVAGLDQPDLDLTAECQTVLHAAQTEAEQNHLNSLDEFILLSSMVKLPESKAGQILAQYAVTVEQVSEKITVIQSAPAVKAPLIELPKNLKKLNLRKGISPVFISLVLFCAAMAAFLWFEIGNNPRVFIFAFVISGWIISVALHEFGHSVVAYWAGDESVEDKGYLTLNPLKYSHPLLSIVIPVLILLIGGIGFPGGAVYINIHALRKPNYRSLVSAAGPLANLLCIILLAFPFGNLPFMYFFASAPTEFLIGVGFLAFLQITSVIINLLPIPGLDGFGILEPFLPPGVREFGNSFRAFSFIILYLFVFIDSPISNFFWSTVWGITELLSPSLAYYANEGIMLLASLY